MTVGELRKALEAFPDDMTVLTNDDEFICEINIVLICKVRKYEDREFRLGYGEYNNETGKDCVIL
jgi:hypothetical protein